ncbi:MAG: hypothetical protein ACIAXF_00200 [Phycisphaerales bacterium JB063]
MNTHTPPTALPRPHQARPADDRPTLLQRARRAIHAYYQAHANRPTTEVLPLGHPRARAHQPGERRTVFGHNVIITKPPKPKPSPHPDKG